MSRSPKDRQLLMWGGLAATPEPTALEHLSIRLPPEDLALLRQHAARHEVALATLIRVIVHDWLASSDRSASRTALPVGTSVEELAVRIAGLVIRELKPPSA